MGELQNVIDELARQYGSADALSKASGLDPAIISKLRRGRRGITLGHLRKLLPMTSNPDLQARLLRAAGVSQALVDGRRSAKNRGKF